MPRLPRTVWALGVVSLLTDLASDMAYPVLPAFLVGTLGATAVAVGLIEGVAEATASLFKLVSGRLSDRVDRRKPLVVTGYGLSGLIKPLLALVTGPWQVLAVRFADRTGKGIRSAPRDALLAAHARGVGPGRVFGLHRSMDTAGAIVGPLVATAVLALAPGRFRLLFALTLVPGLLALAVLVTFVRERPSRPPGEPTTTAAVESDRQEPRPADRRRVRDVLRRELVIILIITVVFSAGNSSDAFLLLRAQDLGAPAGRLPLLWMVLNVVYASTAWWAGLWSDRIGRRAVLALGFAVYAGTYLLLASGTATSGLWGVFALYGLYFGLTDGVLRAAVASAAPRALRGTAFGIYHALTGVTLLGASLLAGFLWERVGPHAPFVVGAATAGVSAVLCLVLLRPPRSEGEAVGA